MSQTPAEVATGAYQWIIQRPDGAGFAATSHDRRQHVDGMTIEPDMDLRPFELAISERMFGSRLDLQGGVSNPALTTRDLLAGRWDGASVQLLASDWMDAAAAVPICEGELGQVRAEGGQLAMAVDLLPAATREQPCIQTSPECRAVLGDRHCRVDMRSRAHRVQVTAVYPDHCTINVSDTGRFAMGRLRWISGPNCGIEQVIMSVDGPQLSLQNHSELVIGIGDRAIVREGCDGRRATCSERFGNILNFRGEPDLPGSEILLRFPGA